MIQVLAHVQRSDVYLSDPSILVGQLSPSSITGYRCDIRQTQKALGHKRIETTAHHLCAG